MRGAVLTFAALTLFPAKALAYESQVVPGPWAVAPKQRLQPSSKTFEVQVPSGGCSTFDHATVNRDEMAITIRVFFKEVVVELGEPVPPCPAPQAIVEAIGLEGRLGSRVVQDSGASPSPIVRSAGALACPANRMYISDVGPARTHFVSAGPRRALLCRYGRRSTGELTGRRQLRTTDATRGLAKLINAVPLQTSNPKPCRKPARSQVMAVFLRPDHTTERVTAGFGGCPSDVPTGGGLAGEPGMAAATLASRLRALTAKR